MGIKGKNISVYNCGLSGSGKSPESVANAHLIAAAPDMYELLLSINNSIIHCDNEIGLADEVTSLCHNIDQALKSARGES